MVETLSLHTLQLPRGVVVEPVLVQVVVVAAPHVHLSAISIALACVETFVVVAAKHDRLEKWCCATNGWQRIAHLKELLKGQIQNLSAPLTISVFTTALLPAVRTRPHMHFAAVAPRVGVVEAELFLASRTKAFR